MGWETRHGQSYYYRKARIGDRVISEYVGGGPASEYLAQLDAAGREEAARQYQQERQERDEWRALERELDEVCDAIQTLTRAALLVSGCHRHKGTWRRQREPRKDSDGATDRRTHPHG